MAPTATVSTSTPVGEIVAADPGAARIFEALQIDFCCGGKQPLGEACDARGLDPATVAAMVAAADSLPDSAASREHDLGGASVGQICDHVVSRHHEPTRAALPRVAELAVKVERAHAGSRPQLRELRARVDALRTELEAHMQVEERTLFPACRGQVEVPAGELGALLTAHESEHEGVGSALATIRELAGDYDESTAFCNTHRVLLHSLRELEADVHQHVHEENNVLFPKVRAALAAR
jgi:regulator of cell morphogenesis and NO signaling